jgi:sortase (surface protein transpeptidase)
MSGDEQHGLARNPRALIAAVLLVTVGLIAIGLGMRAQQHAPQPPTSAADPTADATDTAGATTSAQDTPVPTDPRATKSPALTAATPTQLSIPSIGVNGTLLKLGLNKDKSVQVPPLTRNAHAGWLRTSPTPGQIGPAVILGHVDSKYGPGVFFKLGALKPGATVRITRTDHTVAVFKVDRVVSYPKATFPTLAVYGNTDHAALRLITCGGKFDPNRQGYQSNIVAYASMISTHEAPA